MVEMENECLISFRRRSTTMYVKKDLNMSPLLCASWKHQQI